MDTTSFDVLSKYAPCTITCVENAAIGQGFDRGYVNHSKKLGEIIDVELSETDTIINGKKYKFIVVNDITEKNRIEISLANAIIKTQEDERYEIGRECMIMCAKYWQQVNLILV